MGLQITTPTILQMIEVLSQRTGKSAEDIVEGALRVQVDRLQEEDAEAQRRDEIYALVRELNDIFKEHPEAIIDHGELLYGEDGLPK